MQSLPMHFLLQTLTYYLVAILSTPFAHAVPPPECDCFSTASRSNPENVFLSHLFIDLRAVQPDPNEDFSKAPATVSHGKGDEPVTSSFFNSNNFTQDWKIQTWTQEANASIDMPVKMVNSAQNVFISTDTSTASTYLTLRTTRQKTFQSASEIDSNLSTIFHASIRIRARMLGSPGAVAGIFTYADDSDESDIEILTRDPTSAFRATNQPGVDSSGNEIPGASRVVAVASNATTARRANGLPGNSSYGDWNTWGLDWTKDRTEWLVNEESVLNNTYGVPEKGSTFILNMWGDGGSWSGEMEVGGEARMDVQWVDMVYNTTDNTGGDGNGGCKKVCVVDDVSNVGMPQAESGAWREKPGWWMLGLGLMVEVVGSNALV